MRISARRHSQSSIESKTRVSCRTTLLTHAEPTRSRPASDLRYIPINLIQGQPYGGGDYSFGSLNSTDISPSLVGLPGFSAIQAYGLGIPQSFAQGIGNTTTKYDLKVLGAFLQDSWRATSKMTLNLGLRYDIEAFPTKLALNASTNAAERAYGVRQGIRLQSTNFAPRIGVAYDVRGDSKTVVRANYGLFYDRAPGNLEAQSTAFNSTTVPLVILAGGIALRSDRRNYRSQSTESQRDEHLSGVPRKCELPRCQRGRTINYIANQQRFDPNNSNSLFVNKNFLTAGFPLLRFFLRVSLRT